MIIKQNRGRQWLDWRRRALVIVEIAGGGVCLWLLVALWVGDMGLPRYMAMRDHAAQLDQEILALKKENSQLRGEIGRLQHDPAKIEQLARERLGYVRKGEQVYQISPEPAPGRSGQEGR